MSGYRDYQSLLPQHFPSVRVRSERGNVAVVEEHMNMGGIELVVMAKHVSVEPELHEVFVIGGDAKGSHIRQRFAEVPAGTRVTAGVDIRLRGRMRVHGVFGARDRFRQDYSRILDDFARIAAGVG